MQRQKWVLSIKIGKEFCINRQNGNYVFGFIFLAINNASNQIMRNVTVNNVTINKEHSNVLILQKIDIGSLLESANLFAKDFVWHCFNPKLSYIHGNDTGLIGLQEFLNKLEALTSKNFEIDLFSITTIGDELAVTYVKDKIQPKNSAIEPDAVIIWRIANERITEAGISLMSV